MAGMTSSVSAVDEARPNTRLIASPWKIGSVEDERGADHRRRRRQHDRLEPRRAGFNQRRAQRRALRAARADEVDEQDRVAHDDAGERDEADHRGRGERRAQRPVAEHDADQRQRDGRQHDQRQRERAELRDDEQIDAEDRHAEGRAHVAESHVSDFPFAVPQQRRLRLVERLAVQGDLGLARRAPVDLAERVVDGEHAVDRRLEAPGEFRRHHLRKATVVAEDGQGAWLAFDLDHVAKLDVRALARRAAGGQRRREQPLVEREARARQRDIDEDRLEAGAALRIADLGSADQRAERIVDRLLLDAVKFQRLLVDGDAQPFGRNAVAVVRVDDEVDAIERLTHARRGRAPRRRVGAVDLGEQCRKHRRTGRNLNHFQRSVGGERQVLQPLADVERDGVAGALAVVLRRQVDVEVAHLRLAAHVVVAHQAVEIERRRRPRIGLDRHQFRQVGEAVGGVFQHAVGRLDARAVRQIEHDLKLGLVVERQQLHHHVLGVEQHAHRDGGRADREQKRPGAPAALEQRRRDGDVEAAHRADVVVVIVVAAHALEMPARDLHQQPRRDHHGDEERKQHRHRGVGRDRAHVRAPSGR